MGLGGFDSSHWESCGFVLMVVFFSVYEVFGGGNEVGKWLSFG